MSGAVVVVVSDEPAGLEGDPRPATVTGWAEEGTSVCVSISSTVETCPASKRWPSSVFFFLSSTPRSDGELSSGPAGRFRLSLLTPLLPAGDTIAPCTWERGVARGLQSVVQYFWFPVGMKPLPHVAHAFCLPVFTVADGVPPFGGAPK